MQNLNLFIPKAPSGKGLRLACCKSCKMHRTEIKHNITEFIFLQNNIHSSSQGLTESERTVPKPMVPNHLVQSRQREFSSSNSARTLAGSGAKPIITG